MKLTKRCVCPICYKSFTKSSQVILDDVGKTEICPSCIRKPGRLVKYLFSFGKWYLDKEVDGSDKEDCDES